MIKCCFFLSLSNLVSKTSINRDNLIRDSNADLNKNFHLILLLNIFTKIFVFANDAKHGSFNTVILDRENSPCFNP